MGKTLSISMMIVIRVALPGTVFCVRKSVFCVAVSPLPTALFQYGFLFWFLNCLLCNAALWCGTAVKSYFRR